MAIPAIHDSEWGAEIDMAVDLLVKLFSRRSFPEKLDIVRKGQ